ncbi:DUF3060 domain-containing protein [Mycolicibacterium holsaticum]|uniref:DUF3060 domain-containing protein n=1 Tax=Mycolicibacterium holsaticum TaxID=152142 RepID=UPI001C7DBB45|nr:DUF3060 domain-containing protein [Mycolicibacterium holsaticum]MDA4107324.1 hypothetical protein [Mycolicibacterium holsaticum DSM 44478 = JCM 12374]QZA11825.1 DUF3060 domain-containing protein [Mycolicibacterium holsaticum DSM 44478 = JCM 12374]UNC10687.1 DUF3060 domain-containing protein [Mycolicibacterium holsaticum DSM 44478 = JCM 12374]
MNPQDDDPEARIRQLEQMRSGPGAVELGTTQPTQPTQMPPPAYPNPDGASPYGAPPFGVSYPQGPRHGVPVGLIFGIIAVGVLAVFGVVGAIVWNMSTETPARVGTGVAGGGGLLDPGPAVEVPDIDIPAVEPMLPGNESVVTAPPGGKLSVAGVDGTKTVECDDSEINVSGVNNTVTITGHCAMVTVSGVENQVSLDSADAITVSGFDNGVIYHFGEPEIDVSSRNSVAQG